MATKAFKDKLFVLEEYELYTILGVGENITEEGLMEHYKSLIKKYHPAHYSFQLMSAQDLKEIKQIFSRLSGAYNILIDSENRSKYNSLRLEILKSSTQFGFKELYEKMSSLKKEKPFLDKLHILDEKDLYIILDIDPEISAEQLTAHYKQLVKKYHPDKYSFQIISAKELKELNLIFGKISDAYNVLKDPESREAYNQSRKIALSQINSPVNQPPATIDNLFKNSAIDSDKAKKDQAEKFFIKGLQDFKNDSLDTAIKNFKAAIEIFQKEAKFHCYLGLAMEKKGWYEYAKSEFKLTLLYDPQNKMASDKLNGLNNVTAKTQEKELKSPGIFSIFTRIFQRK